MFVFSLIKIVSFSNFAAIASFNIFNKLFELVLKKKMEYFDTTPIGQILNLLSKDTDSVDMLLPDYILPNLNYMY